MHWHKQGLIHSNHAMLPTPFSKDKDTLRIYLGFCGADNVGRIGFIDVDPNNPKKILKVSDTPVLDIGKKGCFDDNGVVPISLVVYNEMVYLYYIGFQIGKNVPYTMFCGLAFSKDNGETFHRYKDFPILNSILGELYARCGVYVKKEEDCWEMWYSGNVGDGWTEYNGKKFPVYTIKYLESKDGIDWGEKPGLQCLSFQNDDEHGFGRPFVYREDDKYKMYYSVRTFSRGYYIGYAESNDGINWERLDEKAGITVSDQGWDSENLSYPSIFMYHNKKYMFYNGNGCGKTGVGYAETSKNT